MTPNPATASTPPANSSTSASMAHKAVIQSVPQPTNGRAPSSHPRQFTLSTKGIADIIKLETSDGRDAVRFLVDVMQGNSAAISNPTTASQPQKNCSGEDSTAPPVTVPTTRYEDHDESYDDGDPRTPEQRDPNSPNYVGRYAHLYGTAKTTRSTSKTTTKSNTGATDTAVGP